jgi:hypothetical protein
VSAARPARRALSASARKDDVRACAITLSMSSSRRKRHASDLVSFER